MQYDSEYLTLTTEQLLQEITQLRKQLEYDALGRTQKIRSRKERKKHLIRAFFCGRLSKLE